MVLALRNTVVALSAVAALGCTHLETEGDEDVAVETDLASALARGEAEFESAVFIPSSRLEVGTWVAYTPTAEARTGSSIVFVNHTEDASSLAISYDTATGALRVLAAPPDGSGVDLGKALIEDLESFTGAASEAASRAPGAVAPQNVGKLTAEAVKRLLERAATKVKLSGDDLLASIQEYTGNGYSALNKFLREGTAPYYVTPVTLRDKAKTLKQALSALPPVESTTYRYVTVGFNEHRAFDPSATRKLLVQLRRGVYSDKAFVSTSRKQENIIAGFQTVRFEIYGRSGRDVSPVSAVLNEEEILFLPGTKFEVLSVKGEFMRAPHGRWNAPPVEQWEKFVKAASEYFPVVTRETLERELANDRVPTLFVELVEKVP